MNMNKKIMLIIITFFSFCIFSLDVFAIDVESHLDNDCFDGYTLKYVDKCKISLKIKGGVVSYFSEKGDKSSNNSSVKLSCYVYDAGRNATQEEKEYKKDIVIPNKYLSFKDQDGNKDRYAKIVGSIPLKSLKLKQAKNEELVYFCDVSTYKINNKSWEKKGTIDIPLPKKGEESLNLYDNEPVGVDEDTEQNNTSGTNTGQTDDNTISEWKEKECSDITDSKTCSDRQDCVYTGGTCQDAFVASNPCEEDSVKRTLKFFGFLLLIAKYMVPLIIIGFASFDLYKAVVDKDEKSLNKQLRMIIIRIASGIIVFLLPDIVYAIMGLSDKTDIKDNQDYSMCAKCLLKTSECEISSGSNSERTCSSHLTQSECENRDYIWDGQCCRIPTCSTLMLPDECRRRGYNYDTDNKCCKMPSVDGSTSSSTHISSSGRVHGGIGGSY